MNEASRIGGIIHTYQKYDPKNFPPPSQPPPDVISGAFEHLLQYGNMRRLTDEELARAIKIDPSQISGLGPSIDTLLAMLLERKRKILEKYETQHMQKLARDEYHSRGKRINPPKPLKRQFDDAFESEQIRDLERLWYFAGEERSQLARQLVQLVDALGKKYEIDELAAKYYFTGRTQLSIPQALEIKEELEKIDELIKQLEEARETAQIGVIDMEALSEFAEPGDMSKLEELQQFIENYAREMAERQGLERDADTGAFKLTPKAYKIFQGKLLERIFSELEAGRTGRHQGPIMGEGAVELERTKPYEFGDSITHMDVPQTFVNALIRAGGKTPLTLKSDDIEIHRTKNSPKCATVVIMDMSGSMRYDGQYVHVKRMGLAMNGLIRSQFPGDYLHFIEMSTFAKLRPASEIVELMPKQPTIFDPVVRLKVDMSRDDVSEFRLPQHFTNIQHSLQLARRLMATTDAANKQIILITDGLPTAHFEGSWLYMLYPPDPRTEEMTMREGQACAREGITLNMFLVPSWSQSEEDIRFAYRLAESTKGRVFFTAGGDLDRYVVWDYVKRKREIIS
jgi:uncharacterized protein with von Willebrand factor type A (vWA) domain